MFISSATRFFKFATIFCVAVIFLLLATRQRITQTTVFEENDLEKALLEQVKLQLNNEATIAKENIKEELNDDNINNNNVAESAQNQAEEEEIDTQTAFDENMPGAYLKDNVPADTNRSFCKYNYEFPYDLVYTKNDYLRGPELKFDSPYRILYNLTEAYNIQNEIQVTYATHLTANFAYFIPELLNRWEGPISVAAFVPDLDVAFFLEQINQFCYCEPKMSRVSVHIVTHKSLAFSKKDIYFDRPKSCLIEDSSKIPIFKDYDETVIYPINVLRNVARTSALTKHVLLSDIELMPSKALASGFLNMIAKQKRKISKEVFVLPIFEVQSTEPVPDTKEILLKLLHERKAVYFHGLVCEHCQKFPAMKNWTNSADSQEIKPLITVKRHNNFSRWEPIFIGTNAEPLYSEELSWEGFQDKMTQSLEMCLQNYDYTILDNAFLCHWPGVKTKQTKDEDWRADFVEQNRIVYQRIIEKLKSKYKIIAECRVDYGVKDLPQKRPTLSIL